MPESVVLSRDQIFEKLREVLEEALGVDPEEVTLEDPHGVQLRCTFVSGVEGYDCTASDLVGGTLAVVRRWNCRMTRSRFTTDHPESPGDMVCVYECEAP